MYPVVSIIIPVYNVCHYIAQCLDSVLCQTYSNYEIIVVDDGSTDNSLTICNAYSRKNPQIKVYRKKNEGVSSARNYGLKRASGKYIIFLDSDDFWIEREILRLLVNMAEDFSLDVVRGEYIDVDELGRELNTPKILNRKYLLAQKILTPYELMRYVINGEFFSWLFLYKRSSMNGLLFDETRNFQEDIDFEIRYFSQSVKCGYIPVKFYAYRHRKNSLISTPRLVNVFQSFRVCDIFYEYAHKVRDSRLSKYYIYCGIMMYHRTLETVASDLYIDKYNEINDRIQLTLLRKKVRSWVNEVKFMNLPLQIFVPPYMGVRLFRLRWYWGRLFRKYFLRLKLY